MNRQTPLRFYQADVFTDRPFGGNPVAVFPHSDGLEEWELQKIAREMNLSETVFVFSPSDRQAIARLRIFTPTKELPFAGHPVIGTFFVLAKLGVISVTSLHQQLVYECNIGFFSVELFAHGGDVYRVMMSQPSPQFLQEVEGFQDIVDLSQTLGLHMSQITETHLPVEVVSTGLPVLMVPLRTLTAVRSIQPSMIHINEICSRVGASGILAFTTMTVEDDSAIHSRMFGSPIGIVEDPATGSASGALGAYLVQHGAIDISPTTEFIIEQGYELERPSRIQVRIESDDDVIQTVKVGGEAVMVLEGQFLVEKDVI